MANFLSLLIQGQSASSHKEAQFKTLFVPKPVAANESVNIVHYAWATLLPPQAAPPGNWVLLTVAYDLDFDKYIRVLVQASPTTFNNAVHHIVGAAHLDPVYSATDPTRLDNFVAWVKANDLSQRDPLAGQGGVFQPPLQGYYWTVIDILGGNAGPGPGTPS